MTPASFLHSEPDACSCRKGAWDPRCPRHGRSWRELAVAAYFVLLPIAVVLTGGSS